MLIGRKTEKQTLVDLLEKEEPQFCVVYGRRRVGKTFLIRESYNYNFAFQHTGVANGNTKQQLSTFRDSLRNAGLAKCRLPKDWFEAFQMLSELISLFPAGKKVIFIDELPWMDTPRSGLVSALEHFWNAWITSRKEKDVVLVVCGSATSWISKNILHNHGGLYGRVTERIFLQPFCLQECEQYAKMSGLEMERLDVAIGYMVLGGIPYYWNYLDHSLSLSQNIDRLFFSDDAKLKNEFDALYKSLFKNPAPYMAVVTALGTKKVGMTRDEIILQTKMSDSGELSRVLDDLELCGFIRSYVSFGKKTKGTLFQLIDNFTLFYFQFIANKSVHDPNYWSNKFSTNEVSTWMGLAFERLCLLHVQQIKKALGISGISAEVCSWSAKATDVHKGVQIDLIINRSDNVINLCEMKFSMGKYRVTKELIESLQTKQSIFRQLTKTRRAVHLTLVTSNGVAHEGCYWGKLQQEICLEDLFN
ncbi:MAG: ATP-binding protein [Paludibacteraceae bacterium]|nr:ATP-binding protein [Paludibacteraceae bacterium]